MKKKLKIIIVILLLLVCTFAFVIWFVRNNQEDLECPIAEGHSVSIIEGTLTNTGCQISIYDPRNIYGVKYFDYDFYSIDVWKKGKWQEQPLLPGVMPLEKVHYESADVEVGLEPGQVVMKENPHVIEMTMDWSGRYGALEMGKYRLVKWILTETGEEEYYYAEFEI